MLRERVVPLSVLCVVALALPGVAVAGDVSPPAFSRIVIGTDGSSSLEGRGSPGSQVVIHRDGRLVAAAIVGAHGDWTVTLPQSLASGDHRLGSAAASGAEVVYGDDVRIVVPETLAAPVVLTYDAPSRDETLRRHAEDLASAASAHFSEFLNAGQRTVAKDVQSVEAVPAGESAEQPDDAGESWLRTLVRGWLDRAGRDYQREVIGRLAVERPGSRGAVSGSDGPVLSLVWDWLEYAARAYQREIIGKLAVPTGTAVVEVPGRKPEDKQGRGLKLAETRVTPEERKAETERKMREYQERIEESMKKLDKAAEEQSKEEKPELDPAAAEARRKEEEAIRAREAARKAELERRKQENDRRIEEGLKKLEDLKKKEEAGKAAEAKRREEERRRIEDERKADEATRAAAEARRAAEAKRMTAQAEADRKAAEAKLAAEEARKAEEAKRAAAKAEADRTAAEAKRIAAEAARAAEDRHRLAATALPSRKPDLKLPPAEDTAAQGTAEPPATAEVAQSHEDDTPPVKPTIEKKRKAKAAVKRSRRAQARAASVRKTAWHRHHGTRKAAGDRCRRHKARGRYVKRHVVRRGETLWAIASRYYKRGRRYDIIYRANRSQIRNPNLIYPGQRLYIACWKY